MSYPLTLRKPVTRRALTLFAAAGLAATGIACGGDDGGGAGGSVQDRAAAFLVQDAAAEGLDIDQACVRGVTAELSNSDAQAILDDDDEALSMEGAMKLFGLFECFDFDFGDLGDLDFDDLLDD